MYINNYDYLLLYHCAPTLYKKKAANLFSVGNITAEKLDALSSSYARMLSPLGLNVYVLCECDNNALFYVYNKELLARQLASPSVRNFMAKYGYLGLNNLEEVISHLKERISFCREFPHEIGIMLGYPLDDVIGFITHKGKNFLYSGCWKVYGNKEIAVETFKVFEQCRNDACEKFSRGLSVSDILSRHCLTAA